MEAGHLFGRITMLDEIDFVINPVQAADSGTYQCTVQYPSIETHTTEQREINVVSLGNVDLKFELINPVE